MGMLKLLGARAWFGLIVALAASGSTVAAEDTESLAQPLVRAHAHNDYLHGRPLLDALDHGFCSIEADIFLVDGKLLVAHDLRDARPDRTLEALYLDPLQRRARQHSGRIYPDGPQLILLVDIKSAAMETYLALHAVLEKYADTVTRFDRFGDGRHDRAVLVIISGDRPRELMRQQPVRFAALDGRLADLDSDEPPNLMPLISDHAGKIAKPDSNSSGIRELDLERLRGLVSRAHSQRRLMRLWAVPDQEPFWRQLHDAGVDLINTDDLGGLSAFLRTAGGK